MQIPYLNKPRNNRRRRFATKERYEAPTGDNNNNTIKQIQDQLDMLPDNQKLAYLSSLPQDQRMAYVDSLSTTNPIEYQKFLNLQQMQYTGDGIRTAGAPNPDDPNAIPVQFVSTHFSRRSKLEHAADKIRGDPPCWTAWKKDVDEAHWQSRHASDPAALGYFSMSHLANSNVNHVQEIKFLQKRILVLEDQLKKVNEQDTAQWLGF